MFQENPCKTLAGRTKIEVRVGLAIGASGSSMSPPPYHVTTFFRRCLLGAFLSKILTKIKVLDGRLRYCVARSQRPTTTTSIIRPCRPQLYVHVDLNYTSMSTSILRPCRPQLYVHVDLNFTSMLYHCTCLLYTSPSPRDKRQSRMPSSA